MRQHSLKTKCEIKVEQHVHQQAHTARFVDEEYIHSFNSTHGLRLISEYDKGTFISVLFYTGKLVSVCRCMCVDIIVVCELQFYTLHFQ